MADEVEEASAVVSTEEEDHHDNASPEDNSSTNETDESNTLFVGNLPFDTDEEKLNEVFAGMKDSIESISIPSDKNTGRFRGFAFLKMNSMEACEKAIAQFHESEVDGRRIRVNVSLSKEALAKKNQNSKNKSEEGLKKLYVGNLPFEISNDELRSLFEKHGTILETYIPVDTTTGNGRGFGFVTVKEEDYENVLSATNGMEVDGRTIVVSEPLPPGQKPKRNNTRSSNRTKLYVGNLSFYTEVDTLVDVFSEFGTVHDCYLPEDRSTGGSRGFGFVTMDKDAAMDAIQQLNGCEVDGRSIRVNEAQVRGGPSDE